jgi:hypothetical protein
VKQFGDSIGGSRVMGAYSGAASIAISATVQTGHVSVLWSSWIKKAGHIGLAEGLRFN